MYSIICHLFGPIYLRTFSICLALATLLFLFLGYNDKRRKEVISGDLFTSLIVDAALYGIIGARLLHVISEYNYYMHSLLDIIKIWDGGLSIFGGVIVAGLYITVFAYKHSLNIIQLTDIITYYLPLSQAVGRIGCFFAGCCHGAPTTVQWAIKYTDKYSCAPLDIYIHPTQLYSALIFLIYFLLFTILRKYFNKPGQITALYFIALGLERFFIDFLRGDRVYTINSLSCLSFHQVIALTFCALGVMLLIISRYINYKKFKTFFVK